MGLDITAYRDIFKINEGKVIDKDDGFFVYINNNFDAHDDLTTGRYDSIEDCFSFGVGYNWYDQFRTQLSLLTGVKRGRMKKGDKLFELIFFSDCEGVIGAKTSQKIYDDLVSIKDKATDTLHPNYLSFFRNLLIAFELARHDGCVVFN